jgi:hypothetical protein
MTHIVYTYNNFSWIGPNVDTSDKITKSKIKEQYETSIEYKYYQPGTSSTEYPYDYDHRDKQKYVILSNFCLLDDTVLGLPRSYIECFENIMKCIEDEIYLANKRNDNDVGMVKQCLLSNKIIPYLDWAERTEIYSLITQWSDI